MSNMTTEELFAMMEANPEAYADTVEEQVITVDNDLRTITVPGAVTLLGVESDDEVLRLNWKMPKTYGEFDLSEFDIYINYQNEKNDGDAYPVSDKKALDDYITFSWLVGRTAVISSGKTTFSICMKKLDKVGNVVKEFNTTTVSLPVLGGLETVYKIVQKNPELFDQIIARLKILEENPVSEEVVAASVSKYFEENPIDVPTKTSDLQNDSDFQTGTQVQNTVNAAIANTTHFHFEKVTELPEVGEKNIIYLLPTEGAENNNYDEYLFVDGAWEPIGNTDIDLSNYYTKTESDGKYQPKGNYSEQNHTHDEYATDEEVNQLRETIKEKAEKEHSHDYAPSNHNHDGVYQPKGSYLTEHQDISGKFDKSGHTPNKFLGTDEQGNVCEKDEPQEGGGDYALQQATETALGGIKAKAKTTENVEVAIDIKSGKLFVPPYPSSGSGDSLFREICDITTEEDLKQIDITQDLNGDVFALDEVYITYYGNNTIAANINLMLNNVVASNGSVKLEKNGFITKMHVKRNKDNSTIYGHSNPIVGGAAINYHPVSDNNIGGKIEKISIFTYQTIEVGNRIVIYGK